MRIAAITLLLAASVSLAAQTTAKTIKKADSGTEQKIATSAEKMRPWLIEQRRDFHMHPELSNREERTARVVTERLRKIGFTEIRTGVAIHGVVAVLKGGKPGPVVAVRADMDALPVTETNDVPYKSKNPGVKHACGHDAHTTIGLGVAETLFAMRDQIPGTVKFIFQPAEEGPPGHEDGGAPMMVKEGALEDPKPEVIFGLHTDTDTEVGGISYRSGSALASADKFTMTISGKQAHGSAPHRGIDAIVVSAQVINALQTIPSRRIDAQDPVVVTIGMIHGGTRNNIITGEVKMEGTLRTLNDATRSKAKELIREITDGVAKAHGASITLDFPPPGYPVTYNEPALVNETLPIMKKVVGEKNVIQARPRMGAEDFSWFQKVIPGFYYFLGTGNKAKGVTAGSHTPDFDIDEESLVVGVKVMSNVVMDYMQRHAK